MFQLWGLGSAAMQERFLRRKISSPVIINWFGA